MILIEFCQRQLGNYVGSSKHPDIRELEHIRKSVNILVARAREQVGSLPPMETVHEMAPDAPCLVWYGRKCHRLLRKRETTSTRRQPGTIPAIQHIRPSDERARCRDATEAEEARSPALLRPLTTLRGPRHGHPFLHKDSFRKTSNYALSSRRGRPSMVPTSRNGTMNELDFSAQLSKQVSGKRAIGWDHSTTARVISVDGTARTW